MDSRDSELDHPPLSAAAGGAASNQFNSEEANQKRSASSRRGTASYSRTSRGLSRGFSDKWIDLQEVLGRTVASARRTTAEPAEGEYTENPVAETNPKSTTVEMPRRSVPQPSSTMAEQPFEAKADGDPSTRVDVPSGWVVGTSQESIDTMVEEAGQGYYSLCLCLLLRREVPLLKQVGWWFGAIILVFLQLTSLLGLLIAVMMPNCAEDDNCGYPGYICASMEYVANLGTAERGLGLFGDRGNDMCPGHGSGHHHVHPAGGPYVNSRPFCMECRLAVCANNVFNGTKPFHFKTVDATSAADYCVNDIDPEGGTFRTCFPMAQVRKNATLTGYLVMMLVSIGVAVAIMDEKRQILVQYRIIALAISLPSTSGPLAGVLDSYARRLVDHCTNEDMDGLRRSSDGGFDTGDWQTFHAWMAVESPGDFSRIRTKNAVRYFMIFTLGMITYLRRFIILGIVSLTVSTLIMFEGSDPLSVLLNGLATVFLLELDDAIGAAAFSAHYRGRVSGRLYEIISKVEHLNEHSKVDNACCYIDAWIAIFIIFNNVILWSVEYSDDSCIAILRKELISACVLNISAQALQQILRREYMYFKLHFQGSTGTARQRFAILKDRVPILCWEVFLNAFTFLFFGTFTYFLCYSLAELHDPKLAWDLLLFDFTKCSAWLSIGGNCDSFLELKD